MPRVHRLLLPLSAAALLTVAITPAQAHRSAQSLPKAARFSAPAAPPVRIETSSRGTRHDEPRLSPGRGRDDHGGRHDNRRYAYDHRDYERGKEREGHHFGHHGHGDSPGC